MEKGTGAIRDKKDRRDYKFSDVAMGLEPFDWSVGYSIPLELNVKDQNGSSSCGGQAWAYYGQALDPDFEEKSAKFIYAHTNAPGGGSAGRTNCDFVIKNGWGDESKCSSYDEGKPPKEPFMIRKDISIEAYDDAKLDKGLSYAQVTSDIDAIALAIRENKGCVIGICGKNNGTWSGRYPIKPTKIDNTCWNHWMYCFEARLINGKKYIGAYNSWGTDTGDNGKQWISEDYIKYPYIWSVWTLVYNFPIFKFTKMMKFGSIGKEVKELQKRLGVGQDGIFGFITRNAVKKYQSEHNLKVDGIVGINTLISLNK